MLNSLTIIYDNDQVTCDGSVDLTNTEDMNGKMRACRWDIIEIGDGCYDIYGTVTALKGAKAAIRKPTFINVRTVIGVGTAVTGDAVAPGVAFGTNNVADLKTAYGFNPGEYLVISPTIRKFFEDIPV
ncbi:hypothetical protein DTO166G5_3362 [Paecilomyces variotii]|nr:hypothetical protein DTO166G5_3362 [Paecilomyces variotii]KAJ9268332.1 hypothetical protein DTO212C5_5660 [Paecilomyces variotii]